MYPFAVLHFLFIGLILDMSFFIYDLLKLSNTEREICIGTTGLGCVSLTSESSSMAIWLIRLSLLDGHVMAVCVIIS